MARNSVAPVEEREVVITPRDVNVVDGPRIDRLRWIVRILDESIAVPGTNFKFGLDAIVGLFPGGGDVVGALMSGVLIHAAIRAGVSTSVLLAMLTNVAIDMLVGVVPFVGDAFDFAFKSNRRNLDLLEKFIARPESAKRASTLFLVTAIGGTMLFVGGVFYLIYLILKEVF